ncbi:hypothetical protein Tco_0185272 [Tanacetum coccineum]
MIIKRVEFKIRRRFIKRFLILYSVSKQRFYLQEEFSRWNKRILLPSSRRASKSSSKISSMTSMLKHISSLEQECFIAESIEKVIRSVPTPRLSCFYLTRITASAVCRKGLPKIRGTLLSSSISRITKSTGKVILPTSTNIFSAIPIGYWKDLYANLTLILVGFKVSRDSFAYKEYGIRLMLAPRSTKRLQEKVLLKVQWIRKLPGSMSFGGTLFWMIAELSSLSSIFMLKHRQEQTQEVQSNTVQALKVDSVVIENTCSGKENSNSETAFSKSAKKSSLDSETKDVHAIKYKMSKAKERCMTYF